MTCFQLTTCSLCAKNCKTKKYTHYNSISFFLQHNDESDDDEEGDKESDKEGDKDGDKEGDKKGDKDSDNDESDEEDDAQAELLNGQAAVIVFTRATDAIAGRRRAAGGTFRFVLFCTYIHVCRGVGLALW